MALRVLKSCKTRSTEVMHRVGACGGCGSVFSGEPARVARALGLHSKVCKAAQQLTHEQLVRGMLPHVRSQAHPEEHHVRGRMMAVDRGKNFAEVPLAYERNRGDILRAIPLASAISSDA